MHDVESHGVGVEKQRTSIFNETDAIDNEIGLKVDTKC
jgi:hypothetical protein